MMLSPRHRLLITGSCWLLAVSLLPAQDDALEARARQLLQQLEAEDPLESNPRAAEPALAPTEESIARFEQIVRRQPRDYISRVVLAQLYLRLAKEQHQHEAYRQAAGAASEALAIHPGYAPAKSILANAWMGDHRFREALELCGEVLADNPQNAFTLATLGDAQLELGQYDEAKSTFDRLQTLEDSAPVVVRLARWAELHGDRKQAIELLLRARRELGELGAEGCELAWYECRLGDLYGGGGQREDAERCYRKCLELDPDFAAAKLALANLLAAAHQFPAARALYEQAIADHQEPPMMAALGDLLLFQGEQEAAQVWLDRAEQAMAEEAKVAAEAHYREVSLFLSDHDRDPARAVELAERDLKIRQDIYAHDCLAWALHKAGRHAEALEQIEAALRLGTRDAMLWFHAGMVYRAAGDAAGAEQSFRESLEINPYFSLRFAALAQAALSQ